MKLEIVNPEDAMQAERLKAIGTVTQRKSLRAEKLKRLREMKQNLNENIKREVYADFEDDWRLMKLNAGCALHEIASDEPLDDLVE